jgi:hypothetical protein
VAALILLPAFFIREHISRSVPYDLLSPPSPEAVERLTRISGDEKPLARMDDVGTPLLWYLTGCTPVARDEGEVVWAHFGDVDAGVAPILSHATASHPRFVRVPDDMEQRDAVADAAARYDLWPRFPRIDFPWSPDSQAAYNVKFYGEPPSPGMPEGRILVLGLRIFHRLRDVRGIAPDALFGAYSEYAGFPGTSGVYGDGTRLEVRSREGRPAAPPPVLGIVQFRQEGLWHAAGWRTFQQLPGPAEYTGFSIAGVDGSGALLLRIGDRVHRIAAGMTNPLTFAWRGYLMLRGRRLEETVRLRLMEFFLLPLELVRWTLDSPDAPAKPADLQLLQDYFKFQDFREPW